MKTIDDMIKISEGIPPGTLFIVPKELAKLSILYLYFDKAKVDKLIEKYVEDNKDKFAVIKNIKHREEN